MSRPKGSKNLPGYKTPGRKRGIINAPPPEEIIDFKVKILALMQSGQAKTVKSAAEALGLNPSRVHGWLKKDKDFAELARLCDEVVADEIEEHFLAEKHDIPLLMLLKGKRPMYRDNFKIDIRNEALEKLLKDLKAIREKVTEIKEEEQANG